jgi:hypothetical protein
MLAGRSFCGSTFGATATIGFTHFTTSRSTLVPTIFARALYGLIPLKHFPVSKNIGRMISRRIKRLKAIAGQFPKWELPVDKYMKLSGASVEVVRKAKTPLFSASYEDALLRRILLKS